jgi:release factor glutamine methyltransferase
MLQNRATLKQIRFQILLELRQIYTENESDSISRLILEHSGYPLTRILLDPDHCPAPSVIDKINDIIAEIHTGAPIQYILGYTHFYDLKINVDKHVLIPRPETEEMVEHIKSANNDPPYRIIDLGTGSGCLALALKKIFPDAEAWGIDISKEALEIAEENSHLNMLELKLLEMDLLSKDSMEMDGQFDLVVSNPPYVLKSEVRKMDRRVSAFEPGSALFVDDENPLVFYYAIARFCNKYLAETGAVWVEINERMGKETAGVFEDKGFKSVRILRDIHGKERYINASR